MQSVGSDEAARWSELPSVLCQEVAGLLDHGSLQQVRLTCKAWRDSGSLALTTIRPTMTGCLGLQWHDVHQVTRAFPGCEVLDLRSHKIQLQDEALFEGTSLKIILLSNVGSTLEDLRTLRAWTDSASTRSPALHFHVDVIHVPSQMPDTTFGDLSCQQLRQFPISASIINLDLGTMPSKVSQPSLFDIATLTKLTGLSVICGEEIDDAHLDAVSRLTDLTHLTLGPVGKCSDHGIADTLSALTQLQKLYLSEAVCLEDDTVAMLSKQLGPVLNALSLSSCPLLSNECLQHLASMPHLTTLFFSNNDWMTLSGVQEFVSKSSALVDLDFRGCASLSVVDRMQLQRKLLLQSAARRLTI